jgi:1,4-dihydroxy-2-naphthoyl-CoA hydrolase
MVMAAIWFKPYTLEEINERTKIGIGLALGIAFTEIGDDYLKATMPVDERTRQPFGILHGGANVVLAETIASVGAGRSIDRTKFRGVGLEINANHLAQAKDGFVTGIGRPIHIGKTTQVWDIRITNAEGRLTCISRCTMAILETPGRG